MKKPKLSQSELKKLRLAAEASHEADKDYKRASNFDFVIYLLLVIFLAFSVRTFIGEPVRVDGESMMVTLKNNEYMIIEKLSYLVAPPRRGDIIVCYYPGYTEHFVKRVVGVPGDYIIIENGKIYINGNELDESYYWNGHIDLGMVGRVVKQNHVFVVGDNRNHSHDSRSQDVGDIPFHKIIGRAFVVAWPPGGARSLPRLQSGTYDWNENNPDAVYISEWELEELERAKEEEAEETPALDIGGFSQEDLLG